MDISYSSYNNFDSLWLYEPPSSSAQSKYPIPRIRTTSPEAGEFLEYLRQQRIIPPPITPDPKGRVSKKPKTKEKPNMGSYDNNGQYQRTSAEQIDDAVREALEAPRRLREIERRTNAIAALGVLETSEVGSAVTFTRKRNKTTTDHFVGLKVEDDKWIVSGTQGNVSGSYGFTWETFLQWLTTGEYLVEGVRVADTFKTIL